MELWCPGEPFQSTTTLAWGPGFSLGALGSRCHLVASFSSSGTHHPQPFSFRLSPVHLQYPQFFFSPVQLIFHLRDLSFPGYSLPGRYSLELPRGLRSSDCAFAPCASLLLHVFDGILPFLIVPALMFLQGLGDASYLRTSFVHVPRIHVGQTSGRSATVGRRRGAASMNAGGWNLTVGQATLLFAATASLWAAVELCS